MADLDDHRPATEAPVPAAWARPATEVAGVLEVDPAAGLSRAEVAERRRRYGENRLREARRRTAFEILFAQLRSLVVGLLGAAAAASFVFGDWVEGIAIVAVLVLNTLLGFVTELRAVRSMEALRRMGSVEARVRRAGGEELVPAQELVPGDVVLLDEGDVVTADLRLLEANGVEADESALTGESAPVPKDPAAVSEATVLAERAPMLFKGTSLTRGSAVGLVVAVGMGTELGRVARLVDTAEVSATPLEDRLERLGRRLIWITLAIAGVTTVLGIAGGRGLLLMIETGLALAVAAIPEGLPIVATIALARGMWRMAARRALINRLAAVETLGATTLILTDKTGTLTENRMALRRIELADGSVAVMGEGLSTEGRLEIDGKPVEPVAGTPLRALLETAVLCSNATLRLDGARVVGALGDPMEVAFLLAGLRAGIDRSRLLTERPEEHETAFDRATRMMATYHRLPGSGFEVAVKGAPEAVLEACTRQLAKDGERPLDDAERERWHDRQRQLAESGLRVLALARGRVDSVTDDPYRELSWLGLAGLVDPPRREVSGALDACRRAGIRVVMVTGDHAATAQHIAHSLALSPTAGEGVVEGRDLEPLREMDAARREELRRATVFARVDPAQKLDLIRLHQEAGEIVAMTGDGVNDAPALRQADIGVAMGQRGTQVAKEAADMVLADDAFASIVAAVEQGRVIFGNIRKFVFYLLSCNLSEIFLVAGATLLDAPLPILPLQILFLNLVTDVFPALALAFGEGDRRIMDRPPRDPSQPVLERRHWQAVAGYGLLITASVLGALLVARRVLGYDTERAVTVSFLCLALAQLWHVFNLRQHGSSWWRNEITVNPWVWGALALCFTLLALALYLPGLGDVLKLRPAGPEGLGLALGFSLVPWLVGQVLRSRRGQQTLGT